METTLDLAGILQQDSWDVETLASLKEAAFSTDDSLDHFLEQLDELEGAARAGDQKAALKSGICRLMLSDPAQATAWLEKTAPGASRSSHLGQAYVELRRYDEAVAQFDEAARRGGDAVECDLYRALALLQKGDGASAKGILDARANLEDNSAEWNYVRGRLLQEAGEFAAAMESYESALRINQSYAPAMFHLAYLLDLYGNDEQARELYLRCSELPYVYCNALINLAVIHEDNGEFERAAACLRRVVAVQPTHQRAHLYLKDVLAAREMYIDEFQLRVQEKHDAVLDIPVTDFELSVRSRNCLKKMSINTLGDLLRITEAELLAYKNFGETSLREIKAMLAQKGLSLGQNSTRRDADAAPLMEEAAAEPATAEMMARLVNNLDLSVRSRKCLQRLGINTLGELISKSQEELLESRNFGQTSLKEITDRLADMGLTLRPN